MEEKYNLQSVRDEEKDGKLWGYTRVSTKIQQLGLERQSEALINYGVKPENIFFDKMSGRKKDRPGFNELLSKVHENDVIVAESLSRFSRDLQSLLEQVSMLQELGVSFKSLKEGLNFDNSATSKLLLVLIGAIAEFEVSINRERVSESLAVSNKKNGRPSKISANYDKVIRLHNDGYAVKDILEMCQISRPTYYRLLQLYKSKMVGGNDDNK